MSDSLKSFLVDIGFLVNTSEQAKVESAVKATEDKITAATEAGAAKRVDAERRAVQERSRLVNGVGEVLAKSEEERAAKVDKIRKDAGSRDERREDEAAKKARARRVAQNKELEANLLKFTSIATSVSSVLGAALSSAPFGGFLMGVERTAASLSRLSVQTLRVGSSAREIQKYMYAMRQAGVDDGEANGALEGFSSKMKTNDTGYRSVLEGWHVKTTDKDGKPLGFAELLENFGAHLATLQYSQAKIQAGQFGVNGDNALNALRDPASLKRNLNAEDQRMTALGLDPDKAAAEARKVEQVYDRMQEDLKLINEKVQSEFFLPMMNGFNSIAEWLEKHPDATKKLEEGLVAFAALMSVQVVPVVTKLLAGLVGLGGESPALLALLGVSGAKYLAENTQSNVDPWVGQSAGETAARALDPGLADRIYGKRGEQLPQGPRHDVGVHAAPHDTRNLGSGRCRSGPVVRTPLPALIRTYQ